MLKGSNGNRKDAGGGLLERPRKKLSFREPEIMGHYMKEMSLSDKRRAEKKVIEREREKERLMNLRMRISEELEEEDEEELEVNG